MLMLLCTLMLSAAPAQAQVQTETAKPRTAPRDPAIGEKKGTAVLRGKVTTIDDRPLRRVRITVAAAELTESRSVSTNAQGIYEVKDLPAGRYTITATRSGYLVLRYGQRRPREAGRPVQLAEGQTLEHIDFALPRMAVIAGRITDEVGEPAANVTVFPMQLRYFAGKRKFVPLTGGVRTDDTGQYRLIALEPGDYWVMAWTRETWPMEGNPEESVGYAYTYYGGTATVADAQRVKVAFGQEVNSVDFALVPGRVATISGTATTASGFPLAGEDISLGQDFIGPNFSSSFGWGGAKVNPDGSFTLKNIPPGEYKLSVRSPGDKDHPPEGAATTVMVTGADVEGVMLVTGAMGSISGRIVADTGEVPPFGSTKPRINAMPVDRGNTYQTFSQDNGRVREDGTFEVTGAIGAVQISLSPVPSGWAIKSIDYDGRDYSILPLQVRNGQKLDGVTIVLSNRLPTLSGTLVDDRLQPAAGTVILFPEDSAKWADNPRSIRTTRPDQSGAFEFRLVPAGEYLMAPVEYVQEGDWYDPEFLQGLREHATKLTIGEQGTPERVALTLKKES
jgi:hypothetical protein